MSEASAAVGGVVYVYNRNRESFLALRVEVADSFVRRLIGLLGRRALPPGAGLWIVPCRAIHTLGMRFAIDVVLLDKQHRVVGLREQVRPFSATAPNFKAVSVLELPAHTIDRSGTGLGDQLAIAPYPDGQLDPPPRSTM